MNHNFKITLSSLHEEPTKYEFEVCLVTTPRYFMEKSLGCPGRDMSRKYLSRFRYLSP